ncbi:DNA cytosine methyltransferase [uncultured Fusobacterium sp.]|uniref:DNA cytosine methyltransferase n=1 Tax=uncultured Fusobacterium sp. TaxID=159267 RepID=UPI0025F4186D|nr:DNA cytosine methyltransferase [uncultured Fusobacterium sp.]
MKKPLAIDLFCGAGGMSEGILQAGFHIVFSNDKSPEVALTYQNRHEQLGLFNGYNTFFITEDISNLTGKFILDSISNLEYFKNQFDGKIDVIFGGPPCQGFSRAGKRDKNDPRNLLFKEYLRVVSEIKPNYVVMENVVGLLDTKLNTFISYDLEEYQGDTLVTDILENEFNKLGYSIKKYNSEDKVNFKKLILNASEFGVPQKRERVIIVAYKKKLKEPNDINKYKKKYKVNVKEAIADLITDPNIREKELLSLKKEKKLSFIEESKRGRTRIIETDITIDSNEVFNNVELSFHSEYIIQRFGLYKNGETTKDVKIRLLKDGINEVYPLKSLLEYVFKYGKLGHISLEEFQKELENFKKLEEDRKEEIVNAILSKKNIRVRLDKEIPSRTIVTLPDDYISPFENRTFSVREMARLQSFDDSFIFLGKRTTGGSRRKLEVPQYTQVGNAVPPLLAKAIALSIMDVIENN